MAILEGGHIVPPCLQATSRSPAPLGLNLRIITYLQLLKIAQYLLQIKKLKISKTKSKSSLQNDLKYTLCKSVINDHIYRFANASLQI